MSILEEVLEHTKRVPGLPTGISRLYPLLNDSQAGASDFEKVIRPDVALSANLLRLANSAAFGMRRQVESVRHAISLLGLKRAFDAAVAASFAKTIPRQLPGYDIESNEFWGHSSAVAILSGRLASQISQKPPNLIFVAGLLHDIGKLAISPFLGERATEVRGALNDGTQTFLAIEREVLGTDHAEIGYALAESWGLPEAIGLAARWHHRPSEAPPEVDQVLVGLVHAADALAHMLGHGADVGELARQVDESVATNLDITDTLLECVASESLGEIAEMEQLYST